MAEHDAIAAPGGMSSPSVRWSRTSSSPALGLRSAGADVGYGNIAVLASVYRVVTRYRRVLRGAGIPSIALEDYDGTATDAVKVGTFKRAKGLELACVVLPQVTLPTMATEADEPAALERQALARREHFVAMTRARDLLWVGRVAAGA